MKTIQIPDEELDDIKLFYKQEYEQTVARLHHISTVLNRLGVEIVEPGKMVSVTKKAVKRKKPGRKSTWELVIMKRLRQLDKPVTFDQLTDEIMVFTRIPLEKRTATKQAVVNVVFRLRTRDQKLDTFSIGKREKYVALKNWFASPGKIKKEYADRIVR